MGGIVFDMPSEVVSQFRADPGEVGYLAAIAELVARDHPNPRVVLGSEDLELPPSLARLFAAGATALSEGYSLALASEGAEVSPAEAGKLLGVSRQYVDRLVANGILPARQLPHSRYRKIPARAVLAHRVAKDAKRAGIGSILGAADRAGLPYESKQRKT